MIYKSTKKLLGGKISSQSFIDDMRSWPLEITSIYKDLPWPSTLNLIKTVTHHICVLFQIIWMLQAANFNEMHTVHFLIMFINLQDILGSQYYIYIYIECEVNKRTDWALKYILVSPGYICHKVCDCWLSCQGRSSVVSISRVTQRDTAQTTVNNEISLPQKFDKHNSR